MSNTDFSEAIRSVTNGATTLGTALPKGSPERAAKALNLESRSGIPAQIIEMNPEKAQVQVEQQERAAVVSQSPALQTYVNSSPLAAKVSSDDFSALESFIQELSTFVRNDPVIQATVDNFSTEPLGFTPGSEAEEFFRSIGLLKDPNRLDPGAALTEPILRGGVAALDLIGRGFWAATAGAGALVEELTAGANDLVGQEDFFGPPTRAGRETQNFLNFWLLRMGVQTPILTQPYFPLSKRSYEFLKKAEEFRPRKKEPDWHKDPAQLRLENQAIKAEFDAAELDASVRAVVETKTRERAPGMVQTFVEQNVGDRTIGVDPNALRKIYEEQGVVPTAGDPIMGFVPDIAQRMELALATGSDVEVPLSGYLARVDPVVHDKLIPNIRSKEGMTMAEAKEAQDELEAAVNARRKIEGEIITPEQQLIEDEVREVLASGYMDQTGKQSVLDAAIQAVQDDINSGEPFAPNGALNLDVLEALKKKQVDTDAGMAPGYVSADAGPIEQTTVKAKKQLYLDPLFRDPESAGMTTQEFTLYSKKLEAIQAKARAKDLQAIERQTTRELTAEWKTTLQEETARAQAEFDARKDVIAARFLRTGALEPGTGGGEGVPLDVAKAPGLKGLSAKGGVDPDEIAGLLGYATGEELVADVGRLIQDQGRKSEEGYRKAVTEAIAGERARERFGDPGERAQQVIDLIADQDITRLLHDDLRVMQKQGGGEPLGFEELQAWARENFSKVSVKDARKLKPWIQAVTKNGRKAEIALLKGDLKAAFKAKNEQLMATLWLQEAIKFQKAVEGGDKNIFPTAKKAVPEFKPEIKEAVEPKERAPSLKTAVKLIKPYTKRKPPKGVSPEYADQIYKILDRYGVTIRVDKVALSETPPLTDFVDGKNQQGFDVSVADFLLEPSLINKLDQLSVADFEALVESLQSLDHVGRLEQTALVEGKRIDREIATNAIVANIEQLPLMVRPEKGIAERIRRVRYGGDATLVKMDRVFYDWDLRDPQGPFMQTVYYPLLKSEHFEDLLFREAAKILEPLRIVDSKRLIPNNFINPLTASVAQGIPGVPRKIDRSDLMIMALNLGNRHNRDLLTNTLLPPVEYPNMGHEMLALDKARNEQTVLDFVNQHMTKEDWDFVEGVWALFDWLKPMEDQMYRELSGVAPDRVQPLSIETPFGTKTGGYVPVILDPLLGKTAISAERSSFEVNYYKATTPNSYTKKRKSHFEPLMITGVSPLLQSKIRAAIHDIAFRREIMEAGKIIYNPKIREAINKHYGQEYGELLNPWLRYVANHFNEEDRQLRAVSRWMRSTRKNLGVAVLGANLKTILTPQIGPFLMELGISPMHSTYILTHWERYNIFALERSGELRSRMSNMDRDVRDALQYSVGMATPKERLRSDVARFSLSIAAKIDTFLATMSFLKEYERGIAAGLTEEEAVTAGDYNVVKYYGSASPVNLAAALRTSEPGKLLTMFYGYMSTSYNLNRDIIQTSRSMIRRLKKGDKTGAKRDFTQVLADSFTVLLIPAILGFVYNPSALPDEDASWEDWGLTAAKLFAGHVAGTVPFIRDVAAAIFQDLPVRSSPISGLLTEGWRVGEDLWAMANDDDPSERWVKRLITMPGLVFGLPTGQIGTSAQFLWNVNNGEDEIDSLGAFIRGIIYGTSEPGK